jgi:hypothetical protein
MSYPILNLPQFEHKQRETEENKEIWDPVRRRFVVLTPEEWVRQHVISLIIEHLGYPRTVLRIERAVKKHYLERRTDIVVYHQQLPWIIVECKAPHIPIDKKVLEQASHYNKTLKATYLLVTNGMVHLAAKLQNSGFYEPISSLPTYQETTK